jgi:hypothetical protein
MKNIFIFENSNAPHETSIIGAVKIFQNIGFNVVLCLNNKSIERIAKLGGINGIEVINIGGLFGLFGFFRVLKSQDFVLFNTILLRSLLVTYVVSIFSKNKIYYLRNINSWLYKPTISGVALKNRFLGLIFYGAKKIIKKDAAFFIVGSFNMQNYLSLQTNVPSFVIPFNMIKDQKSYKSNSALYTFVIPGVIDLARKDLNRIKEATLLFDQDDLKRFKIILLGYPSSQRDLDFVVEWKNRLGVAIEYYDNFIEDSEFDRVLSRADIIMGVLNTSYQDKYGNRETYGKTKDTGIEAHALAYTKPLIVNSEYQVDKYMYSSTVKFTTTQDCFDIMKRLFNKDIEFSDKELVGDRYSYKLQNLSSNIEKFISEKPKFY